MGEGGKLSQSEEIDHELDTIELHRHIRCPLGQSESLLELEFRDGAIYRSCSVPERTFQEFLAAESQGRYFNLELRDKFVFDPVRPAATDQS